MSDTLKERCV